MEVNSNKSKALKLQVLFNEEFNINRQFSKNRADTLEHHYHDVYEMYYLVSGDRYYFIKDKIYHATEGSIVLIKPFEVHCVSDYCGNPYERILVSFKKSYIKPIITAFSETNLFESFDLDIRIIKPSEKHRSLVESLLNLMLEEYKGNDSNKKDFILKNALCEVLFITTKYIDAANNNPTVYKNGVHKTISEVIAYINNNYFEDITLDALADKFFLSRYYLSRTFKSVTGMHITEYINGVRIKAAQKMLLSSDMNITKIALSVGFKNVTHFGRVFKNTTGTSPLKYRRG